MVEALDKDSESWSSIQEKVKGEKTSGRARAARSREKLEKMMGHGIFLCFFKKKCLLFTTLQLDLRKSLLSGSPSTPGLGERAASFISFPSD